MADTNTYNSFQKVEKWTTKEKFNALDLQTIATGTEYNLVGAINETDLDSDLQTKINGKLTAPTTPTADSVVTMATNGTTGTKALSEFGGKLYKHIITVSGTKSNGAPYDAVWSIVDNHNNSYTFQDIIEKYYPYAGGMPIVVYSDDPATPRFLALLTFAYQIVVGMTVESSFGTATNFKDTVTKL